ncbi:MAG: Biotin carboxyl carrier protein of acetyl-CoA carboxylase [Candidatus Omnitrophica bacterium ADurb.Bin205]|nr:MAG: Biotin carboxyl carrier protein of acetyl-CoA carboxylase [Candidatus Omnitrophica bacterium ADurb.Bin205]
MNIKEIKEMVNLMNDNGLMELEIEKDGMRIRLKKTSVSPEGFSGPVVVERERVADLPVRPAHQDQKEPSPIKSVEIKSPMVGTFYRAPSPESPAYVEVGQNVEPGQVICIIEAMKLMNEIKAEVKGKIIEILVDNAEPIEFGQTIFLIEPL